MEETEIKKTTSKKYLDIISIIIGLVGIGLGIYFYSQSKETRDLSYSISPTKALVVDSKRASKLRVLYDSTTISSDIIAIQLAIWNRGKQSIKKSNILKTIELNNNNRVKILETSIRKVSREVTNFSVLQKNDMNGNILLNWDILENNDGAVIQILFAGNLNTKFFLNGIIEGQENIHQIDINNETNSTFNIISLILGALVFLMGYFQYKSEKKHGFSYFRFGQKFDTHDGTPAKIKLRYVIFNIIFSSTLNIIAGIVVIILAIYNIVVSSPPTVPFGF
jgi:hypothetical protein